MEKPRKGDLVLLEWIDIQTDSGWESIDNDPGVAPCKTVGFVTHVSDYHVSVACSLGVSHHGPGAHAESNLRQGIPWGCVKDWSRLRKAGR